MNSYVLFFYPISCQEMVVFLTVSKNLSYDSWWNLNFITKVKHKFRNQISKFYVSLVGKEEEEDLSLILKDRYYFSILKYFKMINGTSKKKKKVLNILSFGRCIPHSHYIEDNDTWVKKFNLSPTSTSFTTIKKKFLMFFFI